MKLYREWLPSILTTGTAAADRKQWKRHKRLSKLWRRTLLWCQWNTEILGNVTSQKGHPPWAVALGPATWISVTGITRVWPYEGLFMETEAVRAAWGSTALTVYLQKLGKPRCTSFSTTAMLEDVDTTWRRGNTILQPQRQTRVFLFVKSLTEPSFFSLRPHFYINRLRTSRAPLHHFGFIQMSMLHRCFLSWHLRG